jgi:hypothetical protein
MPVRDDDPVTPNAVEGVYRDAAEIGRVVQIFAVSVIGCVDPSAIDAATLFAVETLQARDDVEACAGSITVLMDGQTAGVLVAQPRGAPALKELGSDLVRYLGNRFVGAQVSIGLASTNGREKLELDDAIAVAIEGLEVAAASGSNRAVHSELYELTLATRRRQGTIFPLESVRNLEERDFVPRPEGSTEAAPEPTEQAESLGEFDDPFAHLASEAYELNAESAMALTNGIAPQAAAVAELEAKSKAEIERLRLELEVARREKLQSVGPESDVNIQERRIQKLVDQLEGAEAEIARLREESSADRGVESAYRSVQGLDPAEPAAPTKRVLIDGVFEANRPEGPPENQPGDQP